MNCVLSYSRGLARSPHSSEVLMDGIKLRERTRNAGCARIDGPRKELSGKRGLSLAAFFGRPPANHPMVVLYNSHDTNLQTDCQMPLKACAHSVHSRLDASSASLDGWTAAASVTCASAACPGGQAARQPDLPHPAHIHTQTQEC